MKDIQLIEISKIVINAGTQQRDYDNDVVEDYTNLVKEEVDLPPVEVVFTGKKYILWDGFHRYMAHLNAEADCIQAHVVDGTVDDAIFLSFSANSTHGVRRPAKAIRKIVTCILSSPKWLKKLDTDQKIADCVGVSRVRITQIRTEIETMVNPYHSGDGDSGTDPEAKETGNVKTNVKTDSAETTHLNSDKPALREPTKDGAGNEIPQKLVEVFLKGQILQSLSTDLSRIENEVINLCSTNPPEVRHLPFDRFKVDIENARRDLRCSRPYAVCCYCGGNGKGCKPCKGSGFLTKSMWDNAPRELK